MTIVGFSLMLGVFKTTLQGVLGIFAEPFSPILGVCGAILTCLAFVWSDSLLRREFRDHVPRGPNQGTWKGNVSPTFLEASYL